ncbi:MAG: succinate dehydrogenase cytochrome b subunit [Desulfobulbaceae bacterium]|nr:succinate dehydrogenase cytochrome b subunit [Desulfobulbaceae bacterium]
MSWFTQTIKSSLGKKYIMSLTGLMLGGFLLVHAAGNSSIFFGRAAFLSYAGHLHGLGFLLHAAELLLLAIFLVHILTGTILFLGNLGARSSRYAVHNSAGGRSWGSATMPYTGMVIFCFILIHLFNFHFTDHSRTIADIVAEVLARPFYTFIYIVGLSGLGLHVSHGFWSMFQSLGISHPKYDRVIRACAWLVCGLITAVFILIVLLLLVNSNILV